MDSKKSVFNDLKDKWDFIIALIVICVFGIFIYQFMSNTEENSVVESPTQIEESQKVAIAMVNAENEEQKPIASHSNAYQTETIKVEDGYQIYIDSAIVVSDIVKSDKASIGPVSQSKLEEIKTNALSKAQIIKDELEDELKSEDGYKNNKELDTEDETEVDEEVEIKDVEEEGVEEIVLKEERSTPVKEKAETNAVKEIDNKAFECVIIVGAFKELSNRKSVIEKLTALGYAHIDGELRQGLHYVGVPVSCEDEQKKRALLSELNQAFGINSWVKKL